MKRLLLSWIVLAGILTQTPLNAQDSLLDSIIAAKVDSIVALQKKTYSEVKYVDPLSRKSLGIEFNPAYFLLGWANRDRVLSGTLSLFSIDRKAEIAIPFFYSNSRPFALIVAHRQEHYGIAARAKVFMADIIYRKFLGAHQNGFYFSLGGRYAGIEAETDRAYDGIDDQDYVPEIKKTHKFGVIAGIGYRFFTKSGFYWGTSLSAGRYLTGDMHLTSMDGGKGIIDFELLKFGFTF